jgi:hypothetical protein
MAGAAAAGALAARQVRYGAGMNARRSNFHTTVAVPAAGAQTYASEEEEISALFEKIGQLQEAAMLPAVTGDLDEINTLVSTLPHELQAVRQRGYAHEAQLEEQIDGLAQRWDPIHESVADALYVQQGDLVEACNRLLDTVDRLYEPSATRATVDSCWAGVRSLQSRIEAAHNSLTAMYDSFGDELERIESQIERIEWMLDEVEAAKFQLYQGEAPVWAAKAQWIQQGDDEGPTGLLYLTDQRILFEQKEEVATKKVLFVKLEKETVHQLLFEAPVSAIEAIKTGEQRKGFLALGKVEVIDLTFDHTAQISGAVLHLQKDDAQTWESLIGRVKSGEIDRARTEDAAAEAVMLDEARAEIPTNCPNCNAPLDQALVRGMTSISCQYCGTVVQI